MTTTISQKLVWTALPTGAEGSALTLSVFLAPQLSATSSQPSTFFPLSLFEDFVDWPGTILTALGGPVTFTVTFQGPSGPIAVPADNVTVGPPAGFSPSAAWEAIFDQSTTQVEAFAFTDYSKRPLMTFPYNKITSFVSSIYGNLGAVSPTEPPVFTGSLAAGRDQYGLTTPNKTAQQIYEELGALFPSKDQALFTPKILKPTSTSTDPPPLINAPGPALAALRTFQAPLSDLTYAIPETPTLDFHQALTGLNHYPTILRLFGLAFDLTVTLPPGIPVGSVNVLVTPTWRSVLGSASIDVTPWTAATLTTSSFRPTPQGPDFGNGMLGLNDATRFSVTDLDAQLAANRLDSLSVALQTGQVAHQAAVENSYFREVPVEEAPTVSTALTVPALRSVGPQVIWTGYAAAAGAGFTGLLDGQKTLHTALGTWLSDKVPANLPVCYAEQLIRGLRFDVYTASEAQPAWRSLCGRNGQYTFGPNSNDPIVLNELDEGLVIPGASQKAGSSVAPPPDLLVHESIVRWHGWGLCAQRPGAQLDRYSNTTDPNPENVPPAPIPGGPSAPQLAAYFLPPTPTSGAEYLYPKLRFGYEYRFRARAVDLAGNSLPVTSTDASTATAAFTHYRYEPVRPPVLAGQAPFVPGEATLTLVLLDDQVDTPVPNGRWLFPPRVAESMAEEHGMFDGFNLGSPPDAADGPSGAAATYDYIVNADLSNLGSITTVAGNFAAPLIGTYDAGNQNVPYFTGSPVPWTPWLPDPLSVGPALAGLPGLAAGDVIFPGWGGVWPQLEPLLIELNPGSAPTSTYVPATGSTPATVEVTLPPAEVALVKVSSALAAGGLDVLGAWQWFKSGALVNLAEQGQVWLLSPFQVLRMVHAVRLPLLAPSLGSPIASRGIGSLSVDLTDPEFQVDPASTSHVDVEATWTDPIDVPSDPVNNPAASPPTTMTSTGPAFRLTIPDPSPTGPEAQPLTMVQNNGAFALAPAGDGDSDQDNFAHEESATHHIGDTLHHLVYYTATGTSRFSEMFATVQTIPMAVGSAVTVGEPALGLNLVTFELSIDGVALVEGQDYTLDVATNQVTLLVTASRPSGAYNVLASFEPTVTVTGQPRAVEVLSTARPLVPVISQVVPAWQLEGPTGSIGNNGITVTRTGQFLRVYLDRPWYSSGSGELLGVITTVTDPSDETSTFPSTPQQGWVTMMGLDPINYNGSSSSPWPVVPNSFANLAVVPDVPYRAPYANPPQVTLAEDEGAVPYQVWPYEVAYDNKSGRWYADIAPRPGITQEGTYPPPPGYFIRLALCRFQPYSIPPGTEQGQAVEVSPVVLATFAQPVPDRSVSVVANTADKTGLTVLVSVIGPAYQGWRPPIDLGVRRSPSTTPTIRTHRPTHSSTTVIPLKRSVS